ncbi:MAG: hypothetical protein ACODAA_06285, partial [Gemmatimonadota bacterium]
MTQGEATPVPATESGAADRWSEADLEAHAARIREAGAFVDDVRDAVARRVVGQEEMVQRLVIGLLAGGHVLLEGVPGLAINRFCASGLDA